MAATSHNSIYHTQFLIREKSVVARLVPGKFLRWHSHVFYGPPRDATHCVVGQHEALTPFVAVIKGAARSRHSCPRCLRVSRPINEFFFLPLDALDKRTDSGPKQRRQVRSRTRQVRPSSVFLLRRRRQNSRKQTGGQLTWRTLRELHADA